MLISIDMFFLCRYFQNPNKAGPVWMSKMCSVSENMKFLRVPNSLPQKGLKSTSFDIFKWSYTKV